MKTKIPKQIDTLEYEINKFNLNFTSHKIQERYTSDISKQSSTDLNLIRLI